MKMWRRTAVSLMAVAWIVMVTTMPAAAAPSDAGERWSIADAVKQVKEHDNRLNVLDQTTALSDIAREHQRLFALELENLQQAKTAYDELKEELQLESEAYARLYVYGAASKALKLNEQNVSRAKQEWAMTQGKSGNSMAVSVEELQAQIALNLAQADYEQAWLQTRVAKFQLNQSLGREITAQLELEDVEFSLLPAEAYLVSDSVDEQIRDHPSLTVLHTAIQTYETMLEQMDERLGIDQDLFDDEWRSLGRNINRLREQREEARELGDEERDKELTAQIRELFQKQRQIESELDRTGVNVHIAKFELVEYYSLELEKGRIRYEQQLEQLKRRLYEFVERFERLENRIERYEDNVELSRSLYEQMLAAYRDGKISVSVVGQARNSVHEAELQLLDAQTEYLILKDNFRLFQAGWF